MRFEVGTRVCVSQPVERFPHFVAAPGTGTITAIDNGATYDPETGEPATLVWVRYDKPIAGAEEWDNEVGLEPYELRDLFVLLPRPTRLERWARVLAGLIRFTGAFVARRERCGHSACSQHFIDTGDRGCLCRHFDHGHDYCTGNNCEPGGAA